LILRCRPRNPAFPADEQQRAIDRSSRDGVAFDHADHDIDAGDFRGLAKLVGGRARDLDGMGQILRHRLPCQRSHLCEGEERIAAQPSLAETRDGGPHGASFPDEAASLLGRRFAIEHHRRRLNGSQLEVLLVHHCGSFSGHDAKRGVG
jgi:hypothetical protein